MADLLGTDEFLVNRNDVTYTQEQETLMATLQDTDHLLINRAGQTYKITGSDLINSVIDPLEVTVILAPIDGYTDTEVTAVPVVSGGKQPDGGYIFTYQWVTADDATGTNKTNIAGANSATFTPDNAQVGFYLGCVVGTTDALGTSAEGEGYIGPIQVLAQAPVIADVVVSEIYDGANRFTDKEFPYVTTMAIDGEPNPTYEVKAKLSGTTFDFDVKSDAITDVEGGGIITCETELIESVDAYVPTTYSFSCYNQNPSSSTANAKALNAVNFDTDSDTYTENNIAIGSSPTTTQTHAYFGRYTFDRPVQFEWGLLNSTSKLNVTYFRSDNPNGPWILDNSYITNQDSNTLSKDASKYWVVVNGTDVYYSNPNEAPSINNIAFNTGSWGIRLVPPQITLTFPSAQGFACFEPGDVVQIEDTQVDWEDFPDEYPGRGLELAFDNDPATSFLQGGTPGNWLRITSPDAITSFEIDLAAASQGAIQPGQPSGGVIITNPDGTTNSFAATFLGSKWDTYSWTGVGTSKEVYIEQHPDNTAAALSLGFSLLKVNGVVVTEFGHNAKVISKDANNNTIIVDSGDWLGSDGSGTAGGDTTLVKETSYDTKLTLASSENLELLTGDVFMTDAGEVPVTQTPYKLVTTDIESVTQQNILDVEVSFTQGEDGGNWDDSEEKRRNVFDGKTENVTGSSHDYPRVNDNNNASVIYKFNRPLRGRFRVWGRGTTGAKFSILVNGDLSTPVTGLDGTAETVASGWAGTAGETVNQVAVVNGDSVGNGILRWFTAIESEEFGVLDFDAVDDDTYLTFPGDVSTNPDLRYFAAGDVIQTTPGSAGDWAAQTYCSVPVTGSDWYDSQRVYANLWKAASVGGNAGQCSLAVGKEFTADFSSAGGIPTQGDFYVQADGDWTSGKCVINGESVNESPWVYETSVTLPKTPDGGDPQVARTNVYRRPGGLENNRLMTVYGQRVSSADAFSSRGFYDDNGWIVDQTFYPSAPAGSDVSVISTGYPDSNTMVVDGGNWKSSDQQPVWSSTEYCVSGAEGNGIYSSDRAFSGELVGEELWYAPKGGDVARFETGDLFNDASVLQICYARSGSGQFLLNDQPLALGAGDEQLHTEILTSGFQSLQFDYPSNGNYCALLWIKIDGVLLQDGSGGDDHVEYQTKGGEGTIISTDPDTNTLVIADTGDRDNRWIKGFFVAGPSVIDTPLLTNDVELRASDFATTPPGSDTLKEIIWDINGVEYSAGVTNPWSPLEKLPTNSTVTVKVKYKGNTLEDSDWSPDVTFTTGASIRSLFTRIAALEANDVTDDATDTALLTLIAGLAARIQALEESN